VAPGEAGIALLLQPALSFVWDMLLFGGGVAPLEAGGIALTLAGIYLGSVRRGAARPGTV
jgi:drug/metabolite transporter (DMT)-like permease